MRWSKTSKVAPPKYALPFPALISHLDEKHQQFSQHQWVFLLPFVFFSFDSSVQRVEFAALLEVSSSPDGQTLIYYTSTPVARHRHNVPRNVLTFQIFIFESIRTIQIQRAAEKELCPESKTERMRKELACPPVVRLGLLELPVTVNSFTAAAVVIHHFLKGMCSVTPIAYNYDGWVQRSAKPGCVMSSGRLSRFVDLLKRGEVMKCFIPSMPRYALRSDVVLGSTHSYCAM